MTEQPGRFGAVFPPRDLDAYAREVRLLDDLGFAMIGKGDSQALSLDPYVTLSVAAANTKQAMVGTLVTNPVTRHPAASAAAVASLQVLSHGRAFFGIGTGDSSVYNLGRGPVTLRELEEYGTVVRRLCAGETVPYQGTDLRMLLPNDPVPLYISAGGPKTLRTAGRIADGVIIASGLTKPAIQEALAALRQGADEAGRTVEEIDVWWLVKFSIAESRQVAVDALRFTLAASANHVFRRSLVGKGVPPELEEPIRKLHQHYSFTAHGKFEAAANADLVERYGLTDYLADRFAIAGTPDECAERIRQLRADGAKNLMIALIVPDRIAFLRQMAAEIMPNVG